MDDFKDQVKKSFHACKTDIDGLRVENSQLRDKLFILEQENRNLKEELRTMNSSMVDMKAEIKGLSIAINFIKEFNEKQQLQQTPVQPIQTQNPTSEIQISPSEPFSAQLSDTRPQTSRISNRPSQTSIPNTDPYEALLAFKAKSNKREILKQKLISMVGENGMSLSELKFMFVDHFRYCSKATFYNYLKELEFEKYIKVERENSRNYVFLMNSIRREI